MIIRIVSKLLSFFVLLFVVFGSFVYSACDGGAGDGILDPGEQCDNGIWNGTSISFTTNPGCNSDCTIRVGCFRSFNPYTNLIREYSNSVGNCASEPAVECTASSTCPSFSANGDCKEGWQGNLRDSSLYCCANGGRKDVNGGCPTSCNSTVDCFGTCGGTAIDYNGSSTAGCGSPPTYSYRKCGIGPSWYNYGSPSNPNGGLTTCSPETSLGSSYAMGDFVCRSSQPSASICGNTCTTLPSNSVACAGTPAPSSNTNYSLAATCANAGACTATCKSPYVYNGSSCVLVSYIKYTCHSSGTRANIGSCMSYSYVDTADYYSAGQEVCLNDPAVPSDASCKDPGGPCNIPAFGCFIGEKSGDNDANNVMRNYLFGPSQCSCFQSF